jgi:transcriptional antiterminator RfaH
MSNFDADSYSWYVVHTHPKKEDRTCENLIAWGVETLAPKLRAKKYNQFTGKATQIAKPFFPGYIFSRFRYNELYHKIRFTRGVHSLISFNNKPVTVDDALIDVVRSRIGGDGFVKEVEQLQAGDEVVINDGRFQNFCGVFERDMPEADRVRILLNTVNFQAHIVVDRSIVNKVTPEKRAFAYGL